MTKSTTLFVAAAACIVVTSVALLNGPLLAVVLRIDSWSQSWERTWLATLAVLIIAAVAAVRSTTARAPAAALLSVLLIAGEAKLLFYGYVAASYPSSALPPHFSILISCVYVATWCSLVFVYLKRNTALAVCAGITTAALALAGYAAWGI